LLIRLYRNDTLLRYISFEKARKTKIWNKKQDPSLDKNSVKIMWNTKQYAHFHIDSIRSKYWIFNHYNNKPSVLLLYEDIHKFPNATDKLSYIKDKIHGAGFDLTYNKDFENNYKQETKITDLSEHFINPDDFKKSHKFIKRYLK
jgi:hypothetical protein